MKAGYKRDADAFTFAALFNTTIYYRRDLQQLLEEEFLAGRELWALYKRHQALFQKRREEQRRGLFYEVDPNPTAPNQQSTADLEKRLNDLIGQVSELKRLVIWVGVGLGFVLFMLLR
jgi:hypothetical protein